VCIGRQRDLVATEPELHGANEHLDIPAVALVAHAESDQRRELQRTDRTDPGPALAVDVANQTENELLPHRPAPRLRTEHELHPAIGNRRDEVRNRRGSSGPITGDEHDNLGHARERAEVLLRALARGTVAATWLAQDECPVIASNLGAAIGRSTVDHDDRAQRSVGKLAQQWREAGCVIAHRHYYIDERRLRHCDYGTRGAMALTYKDAGVDIDAGNALVERIKPLAKSTMRPEVLGGIGGFAALCRIPTAYKEPILVSGTDGVGTKLKTAFAAKKHDTIGIDLVAMCVNDVLVTGAEPLFFLDYFASGALDVETGAAVIAGIAEGCRQSGCALVGGETAELPGLYHGSDYDLAGFCVGVVEKSEIRPRRDLAAGDIVIGLPSAGLHSNGHSLARKVVLEKLALPLDAKPELLGGSTVADEMLRPTIIYASAFTALRENNIPWKGAAHITGGGLVENPPRIFADDALAVELDETTWEVPPILKLIASAGVAEDEMRRTFNMGLGMLIVVPADVAARTVSLLASFKARVVGTLVPRASGESSRLKK